MLQVKILSYKSPQRFAVRRTLMAAQRVLRSTYPDFGMNITEVKVLSEIEAYTHSIILPSLVVNEKLVCTGRFPKTDEVVGWLEAALKENERLS